MKNQSSLCKDIVEVGKDAQNILFVLDSHNCEHIDFPDELIEYDPEDEYSYIYLTRILIHDYLNNMDFLEI